MTEDRPLYDDADFPPLAPARQQSIALDESRRSTPPIPPGFEGQLANESRRSTPTIPPGLSRPNALPDLEGTSRPSSRASLRQKSSQILPALPLRPGTPARPTPSRKGTRDESEIAAPEEMPAKPSRTTTSSDLKNSISVQEEEKASASKETEPTENTEAALDVARDATEAAKDASEAAKTDDADERATKTAEVRNTSRPAHASKQKSTHEQVIVEKDDARPSLVTPKKSDNIKADTPKRKHPGKLDITAAVNKQEQELPNTATGPSTTAGTPGKSAQAPTQAAASKLPESPSVASPAMKSGPRTLRVVQTPTPKAETPPHTFPTTLPNAAVHRLPSRQPSVASINLPGTPSSEHVSMSDNISMTSTSQSRANSPPLATSKIGTAPVRTRTKNQMKKERQERAKTMEEEKAKAVEAVKPPVDEPAQEAIVSRQKKKKKEKEVKPPKAKAAVPTTAETTPTASRPASPGNKPAVEASTNVEIPASVSLKEAKPATPTNSATATPQPAAQSPAGPSPPPTPTLTAAQLIAELKASAPEIQKCIDSLFRVSNSHQFKTPSNVSHKDLLNGWKSDWNIKLTKEEVDTLLTGKAPAVYRGGGEGGPTFDRHMVSPSGAHLRALTNELESRFLELEKALRDMPEELRFRPSKPQNEMKLPSLDLEEVKRKFENSGGRGVSVMEQMVQDGSTMKKGAFLVDEASKYINEFVMPPVTPPPSAGRGQQQAVVQGTAAASSSTPGQQAAVSAAGEAGGNTAIPSVEIAERQLNEAKRVADEKENALRKMIKKNKRMLGLS
ncbi:general negative regulator of transcription subunit 4 [Lecanosticta acicola]|uniref:General negative regulator of transcription subunit 4 n=1 Tax=Lecanosticta acicola TaxID=111012 RepID=A0AAI8YUJ4_9PEZI|nr:general negative regulator of transcription subunit 4 [Lecanosticta acicola]